MAFTLGNFAVDEVILGVAQNSDGDVLYTLDQLSSANIEISSESTEITDKKGNVIRTIYKTKSGTFTATNAFLHPQVLNAQSGSDIEVASDDNELTFPKVENYAAGASVTLDDGYVEDTIHVIGVYGNGANTEQLTASTAASVEDLTYVISDGTVTLPDAEDDGPISYVLKYDRTVTAGLKITNEANVFADMVQMTLYCSIVDPCSDTLRSAYVYMPSLQPSPETTINLDSEEQEIDFTANLQPDFCSTEKVLYIIYFPDEDAVTTAIAA